MNEKTEIETFGMLFDFLDKFGARAEARGRRVLSFSEKKSLTALFEGGLGPQERRDLVPLLSKNEVAMEFLAKLSRI